MRRLVVKVLKNETILVVASILALISCFIVPPDKEYAGYIHARATRGWRGSRSAWLSIVGFSAVIFNFTIVNMFFKGLHAYSGLS